jgi:hypothetical protein
MPGFKCSLAGAVLRYFECNANVLLSRGGVKLTAAGSVLPHGMAGQDVLLYDELSILWILVCSFFVCFMQVGNPVGWWGPRGCMHVARVHTAFRSGLRLSLIPSRVTR